MPLFEFEGRHPVIAADAWVAPTAVVVGDVTVGLRASLWYNTTVRADLCSIVIGDGTNIQDNSALHADGGQTLEIADHVTIGHGCVIHCARIGSRAVIGNGAVVLNGAVVGAGSVVAAGSVVTPGTVIPDGVLALGSPARVRGEIAPGSTPERLVLQNADAYVDLARRHASGARPLA